MTNRRAILLLLSAAVLWSLGGVLIKSVEWPSLAKAGGRSAIAAIVIGLWLGKPQLTWRLRQHAIALAYVLTVSLFVVANDHTTAANAIFLQYTSPIYVALLGYWLLGERARPIDWVCIAVALVGIGLFFCDQIKFEGLLGNLAALASGLSFGLMVIMLRQERDASPGSALLLGNVYTALIGLPFAMGHPLPVPQGITLIVMGVVQLGLPYILYCIAIRHVTALEAILIPMLEPILNPLWVALVQGETPGPWSIAGGTLVLTAVLVRGLVRVRTSAVKTGSP